MPRALNNLTKSVRRVTLCAAVVFVAGCDVKAPETGAPARIDGLTTPRLLTGPEIAAATAMATTEPPPPTARAAALRARASALQGEVLDASERARLLAPPARP